MSEPLSLKIDLGKVDTSRPCPESGDYIVTCTKVEVKPNKDQSGRNLVVTETLDNGATTVPNEKTGETTKLSPGYPITSYFPLQPWKATDKNPEPDQLGYAKQLARLYDGYFGTDNDTRPESPDYGSIVGKKTVAKIKAESGDQGWQPSIQKRSVYNG